ncbi:MAG: hypothetical protein PUJ24_04320, partial [Bacteroidales bacterium]|nr:hypothetical protein [Bacteroidales bacterium]
GQEDFSSVVVCLRQNYHHQENWTYIRGNKIEKPRLMGDFYVAVRGKLVLSAHEMAFNCRSNGF